MTDNPNISTDLANSAPALGPLVGFTENYRERALDFALRYPPRDGDVDADKVLVDAEKYRTFMDGDVQNP